MREDDLYLKKINNADDLLFGNGSPQRTKAGHYDEYETSRPTGGDQTSAEEKENKENVQTTEFDDSADE